MAVRVRTTRASLVEEEKQNPNSPVQCISMLVRLNFVFAAGVVDSNMGHWYALSVATLMSCTLAASENDVPAITSSADFFDRSRMSRRSPSETAIHDVLLELKRELRVNLAPGVQLMSSPAKGVHLVAQRHFRVGEAIATTRRDAALCGPNNGSTAASVGAVIECAEARWRGDTQLHERLLSALPEKHRQLARCHRYWRLLTDPESLPPLPNWLPRQVRHACLPAAFNPSPQELGSEGEPETLVSVADALLASRGFRDGSKGASGVCLLPGMDFVNHANAANVHRDAEQSTREQLRTTLPVAAGSEMLFAYGRLSRVSSFVRYGFLETPSPKILPLPVRFDVGNWSAEAARRCSQSLAFDFAIVVDVIDHGLTHGAETDAWLCAAAAAIAASPRSDSGDSTDSFDARARQTELISTPVTHSQPWGPVRKSAAARAMATALRRAQQDLALPLAEQCWRTLKAAGIGNAATADSEFNWNRLDRSVASLQRIVMAGRAAAATISAEVDAAATRFDSSAAEADASSAGEEL